MVFHFQEVHILCTRYGTVLANTAILCMHVRIVCRYVEPPGECYYNTLLRCNYECGIARFLCTMRVFKVRASSSPLGYILPNFVSFTASIAELSHGEKLRTQSIIDPAYLMPWEPKLALRNNNSNTRAYIVRCGQ